MVIWRASATFRKDQLEGKGWLLDRTPDFSKVDINAAAATVLIEGVECERIGALSLIQNKGAGIIKDFLNLVTRANCILSTFPIPNEKFQRFSGE
jgi:hypothetical protein